MRQHLAVGLGVGLVILVVSVLASVKDSEALPAWARKYTAECAMCHYPAIPRLNSFGQQFRRAGYRAPVEFNQDQDVTKVGEFLAGRLRTQLAYDNTEGRIERSEFRSPEAALFYAGAFSRHFSGYLHGFADNSTNVDFHGHLQGVLGNANRFVSVRAGQMHMLQQEGFGGFDRPTGITTTPVHSTALTRNGVPVFNFDQRQKGIELAYVQGRGRLLAQITNGLDAAGSGTASSGDIDPQKDYLLAYEHILDEVASGLTAFYYNGTTHGTATSSALSRRFDFSRLGVNANKILPVTGLGFVELQGGYIRSYDNVPAQVGQDVEGNAWYVESKQYLTGPDLTVLERVSLIDLDAARRNSVRKDYTVGIVTPVLIWLRVAAEYTYTENRASGLSGHLALLEFQGNW